MKRPIDPNLNSFADDLENMLDDGSNGFTLPKEEMRKNEPQVNPEFEFKDSHYHGGSHHHHSSSGEHHHHSSSGEHHHHSSSGEHHHHSSSGGHHHSSSASKSKKKKADKKKKKLPIAARIAIAILIILLLLVFSGVAAFFILESKGESDLKNVTTEVSYRETLEYNGHTYAYNDDMVAVAFLGVDKRELGMVDNMVGTAGQSDANIVLAVDTKTGKATAIAVPRDTITEVDLYSESGLFIRSEEMQLCLSYAYGNGRDTSAANTVTSISRILGNIPISKYFSLDLDGIAALNDAIGGVTLVSMYDIPNFDIRKGETVHLKGEMAEKYVRSRSMDSVDASLNRTARQLQYVKSFAAQLIPAAINDFSIVSELYSTAKEYSSTDVTLSNATYVASLMLSKNIRDFDTITLKGEMTPSDKKNPNGDVYAEFHPDEDALMETIISVFYEQID